MAARHPGPSGRRYLRNRRIVLEASDLCWWCGHLGAQQADHVVERRHGGGDEVANLRPIHGNDQSAKPGGLDYRCPTCGRSCNLERNRRSRRGPPPAEYRSRRW